MQQDYMLRMIEEAGRVLRALRDRILGRAADKEALRAELAAVFETTGMDLELVLRATPQTLFMMIAPLGEVDLTRCWMLAEALYLAGLTAETEGEASEARDLYEKALPLYRALAPGATFAGMEEAHDRITEIEGRVSAFPQGAS